MTTRASSHQRNHSTLGGTFHITSSGWIWLYGNAEQAEKLIRLPPAEVFEESTA